MQARAEIQSAAAAIGGGRYRYGRTLLSGSLLVILVDQLDGGGAMRSPMGPQGLEIFRLTGSNKNDAKGAIFLQGFIA